MDTTVSAAQPVALRIRFRGRMELTAGWGFPAASAA